MFGVHLSREIYRSIGGDQSQCRRALGRHTQSDSFESGPRKPGTPKQWWWQRRQRPLVQIQRCRARQHESQTNVDLALRQGR